MMAVTGRQLGSGPAVLWEMTLFGPIKVRLCVDTSIHMIITLEESRQYASLFTAFPLSQKGPHTNTHKFGQSTASFNGYFSCLR